jgi:hypothetical protein
VLCEIAAYPQLHGICKLVSCVLLPGMLVRMVVTCRTCCLDGKVGTFGESYGALDVNGARVVLCVPCCVRVFMSSCVTRIAGATNTQGLYDRVDPIDDDNARVAVKAVSLLPSNSSSNMYGVLASDNAAQYSP